MLPELNSFEDLFGKLEHDMKRLSTTGHIYELLDCLLTLNALPEWIKNSPDGNEKIKQTAHEKLEIMKGRDFDFNQDTISEDIDQKLRLIRLVCNHAKHKTDSNQIPKIVREYGATFPFQFPAKLGFVITVGDKKLDAEDIILEVVNFWKALAK